MDDLFESAPLPYKFVEIPKENDLPINRENKLLFYVNKVITELSRDAFKHCGFEQTEDIRRCNCTWGRQYPVLQYSTFSSWQKCNHFCGANLMGRKDRLNQRMDELKQRVGEFADFYPNSYLLPNQKCALQSVWKDKRLWIVKPVASARGQGIHVASSELSDVPDEEAVVQEYIEKPMLITGRKFDLRFYVLVTSCSPLRIYMHDSGLVRFATHKYDPNAPPTEERVHLTNFALNKEDENFIRAKGTKESIEDSKWSIPFFIEYLRNNNYDVDSIFADIERVTVATIIAGFCSIRNHQSNYVKHRQSNSELFGIDILLDEDMKAHVLEINISPGMSGTDSPLDYAIKSRLMHDTLRMFRIIDCDATQREPCPALDDIENECSLTKDRIRRIESFAEKPWDDPTFNDIMIVRDLIEEEKRLGGFRRLYPLRENHEMYNKCFDRLRYNDIVLSEWIKMPDDERKAAILRKFDEYRKKLVSFTQG